MPWRSPATATPRWSAGPTTTAGSAPRGSSRATPKNGPSRAPSSPLAERAARANSAQAWRLPRKLTPTSSETLGKGEFGYSVALSSKEKEEGSTALIGAPGAGKEIEVEKEK